MKNTFYLTLCLLLAAALLPANRLAAIMPANDNACDATPITIGAGCDATPNIQVAEATAQAGEPFIRCNVSPDQDSVVVNSVWFTFVAPAEEILILAAAENAATRDAYEMTLYTVADDCADFGNFTEVACVSPQTLIPAPRLQTTLTEGTTYYVRVSGRSSLVNGVPMTFSSPGCLTIDLVSSFMPPNDDVCNATELEVDSAAVAGFNLNATAQDGEGSILPPFSSNPIGLTPDGWAIGPNVIERSVWYTFTTDAEGGNYTIDLLNNLTIAGKFNMRLALYTAGDCNDFSTFNYVGAADNSFQTALLSLSLLSDLPLFCLPPNTTYYVLIDGSAPFLGALYPADGFFRIAVRKEVAQPISLARSISFDPSCAGESDGTILTVFTGGTGEYSYAWSTGDTIQDLVGNLAPGDYTLTVSDQCGFERTETFTLGETRAAALTANPMAGDMTICEGEEVSLSANAAGGRPLERERLFIQSSNGPGSFELMSSWLSFPQRNTIVTDTQRIFLREMEFVGEDLYGITQDALFYGVDEAGSLTFIDSLPILGVRDLSYAPGTGKLYVLDADAALYEVNTVTGNVDSLFQLARRPIAAAMDTSGQLHGVTVDSLFRFDLATGAVVSGIPSPAGTRGLFSIENDPATDILYLSTSVALAPGFGGRNWQQYAELDKMTGALTVITDHFEQSFRTTAFAIKPGIVPAYGYNWMPADGSLDDPASSAPSLVAAATTTYSVMVTDACGTMAEGTVMLTVSPTDSVTLDTVITVGETYEGTIINGDTLIVRTLMSANGCDSIVTTNVEGRPVSTQDTWPVSAISLSPNPATSHLQLSTEGISAERVFVTIRDVLGRPIQRHLLRGQTLDLDISSLAAGQYYLELSSSTKRGIRKFVKR